MTLIEILISCVLLITLTLAFFMILSPTLRRTGKIDQKQENLQRFIIFKEYLTRRIDNAQLITDNLDKVKENTLEFYVPYQKKTDYGMLNRINLAEMIYWNDSQKCTIQADTGSRGDCTIVEHDGENDRILWNLGKQGKIHFDFYGPEHPLLQVKVSGVEESERSAIPWEKSFKVYIKTCIK